MFTGSKYDETQNLNPTQVAKLIRADLAAAKKAGVLPDTITISVRTEYASMYAGLQVRIKGCANAWLYDADADATTTPHYARYTADADALLDAVKEICLAYQRTEFRPMSDYYYERFHLNATYVDEDEARIAAALRHRDRADKEINKLRTAGRLVIGSADLTGMQSVRLDGKTIGTVTETVCRPRGGGRRQIWGAYRTDGTGFVRAHLDDAVYYLLPGKNPPKPLRPTHPARFSGE